MSQFAEDVRLLGELNGLIERAQRQAAPPEFAGAVLGESDRRWSFRINPRNSAW